MKKLNKGPPTKSQTCRDNHRGDSSYSGCIQLQTQNEKAMFYWFFEAQTEPALKPLVIWLNGGHGYSSMAFGAT
ncbi:hypothetical protein Patl1_19887 [Pistacia atlantica]|uniref:Uncharacterized protein n=1 Tax=Pistacia atlantica TaxID=434234 RepID=A0ACC1BNC1_9ROSI|nr:hypothetical protein Patl1_19887 [Pistacia atlantica]